MTGITPFPNECDKEVVDKVIAGTRPERPSNDLSHGMSDKSWDQIAACWDGEPNKRPTALEILLALGGLEHREPPVLVENSDDEVMMTGWDLVEGDPEESTLLRWLWRPKI